MFDPLTSFVIERAYKVIPGWIERRMLPPSTVQGEIKLDLGRKVPVQLRGGEVPTCDLYFEISNLSQISVTLDRLMFEVWFGQPTFRGAILSRREIPRRKTVDDLWVWTPLGPYQVGQIKKYAGNVPGQPVSVAVNMVAYFESRVGWLRVEHKDSAQVSVSGLP
jgi:hypothetical protein